MINNTKQTYAACCADAYALTIFNEFENFSLFSIYPI